jgi:hypothetical protein
MNMKLSMALLAVAGFALPAHALTTGSVNCGASTTTTAQAGYVSCLGSYTGNMDNQLTGSSGIFAAINSGFNLSTNKYFASESFGGTGNPFKQNEGVNDDGVINFDQALSGSFVLGLKQGSAFSLYLFDGSKVAGGISSIAFDTNGVKSANKVSFDLSHAGFFGAPVTAVPEPESYALMLAGLAAMAFVAKRRKAA